MHGAHCLDCREDGPDLVMQADLSDLPVRVGIEIAFTCGRCGKKWRWTVVKTETGFLYTNPRPDITH